MPARAEWGNQTPCCPSYNEVFPTLPPRSCQRRSGMVLGFPQPSPAMVRMATIPVLETTWQACTSSKPTTMGCSSVFTGVNQKKPTVESGLSTIEDFNNIGATHTVVLEEMGSWNYHTRQAVARFPLYLVARASQTQVQSWISTIPWEGNNNPLQYSCLENPMDEGSSWATVHEVAESDMAERLCTHTEDRLGNLHSCLHLQERGRYWISVREIHLKQKIKVRPGVFYRKINMIHSLIT